MWKFEALKKDGTKKLSIMEQKLSSEIFKLVPEMIGFPREEIRVFYLDKKAYLEGKELLKDRDKYKAVHLPDGSITILKKDVENSWVMTITAIEKQWKEVYREEEIEDDLYVIKED